MRVAEGAKEVNWSAKLPALRHFAADPELHVAVYRCLYISCYRPTTRGKKDRSARRSPAPIRARASRRHPRIRQTRRGTRRRGLGRVSTRQPHASRPQVDVPAPKSVPAGHEAPTRSCDQGAVPHCSRRRCHASMVRHCSAPDEPRAPTVKTGAVPLLGKGGVSVGGAVGPDARPTQQSRAGTQVALLRTGSGCRAYVSCGLNTLTVRVAAVGWESLW